jgi:hypothetical protein
VVVGIAAHKVGVAVYGEANLREVPDEGGLFAQDRAGLFVEFGGVEGEVDRRRHLFGEAFTQHLGVAELAVVQHDVGHRRVAEVALVEMRAQGPRDVEEVLASGQGHRQAERQSAHRQALAEAGSGLGHGCSPHRSAPHSIT